MAVSSWRTANEKTNEGNGEPVLDEMAARASRHVVRQRKVGFHSRRFTIDDDDGRGDWRQSSQHRTVQIRFSCVPESIVDALYGLRAIERQFGRIRDYRLLRDSEIRSEYQAICWAAFESPSSLLHVPPQGTTMRVTLPPRLGRPEGGPGLDVVKNLLVPGDRSEFNRQDTPKPSRSVMLNIKHAGSAITFRNTVKSPFRSRAMKAAIGHAFLEWGGFAPLNPLHESSPFSSPTRDLPPLDSKHMRMALNKWSQILGVADPLFPEMERSLGVGDDWEPLSGPADTKADPVGKMSHDVQETLMQSLEGVLQCSKEDKA